MADRVTPRKYQHHRHVFDDGGFSGRHFASLPTKGKLVLTLTQARWAAILAEPITPDAPLTIYSDGQVVRILPKLGIGVTWRWGDVL